MTDLTMLADLGEFVSGVAVVVSLVYLAFQVRQNTRSLQAENYARGLDRVAQMQARLSADAALARIFGRAALDPATLAPEERIRFTWALYEMFGAFEFMFHQARRGALPAEVWERWSATLAWWISLPGVEAWWQAKPAPFSASFSSHVGGIVASNPVDREAARRWQQFLAGGAPASEADAVAP